MFDIGIDMLRGRDDDDNSSTVSSGDGSSDGSSEHYSQDGAPLDLDGTPQLALELLPESTLEQQKAMDEFVNAPSRDKWLELVEKMRLQREEQMLQFYSDNPNVNENTVHRIPADPPLDTEEEIAFNDAHENDDMRGWSMRANEQDEEVSQQLKSMLNNSFRYNAYTRNNNGNDGIFILDDNNRRGGNGQGFTSHSPKPLVISRRMMMGIFLLGFLLGSVVIVVSFYFDKKPRKELNILNVGLRGQGTNSTSNIIEEMGKYSETNINQDEVDFLVKEDLLEIAKFCGRCHWKNAKGINCNQRVKWEMENYQMTEIEAKRANIKHCEKNSDTCRYDGDQC